MDGVSAAASIIALVTVALQSSGAIHAVVSGIRDGPEQVSQLILALEGLNGVLQQLSRLQTLRQDGNREDLSDLENLMGSCVKDIDRFRRPLAKLQHVPADKTLGRAWKQVKSILHKEEFREMRQIIHDYVSRLNLQLNIIQSNADYKQAQGLQQLNEKFNQRLALDNRASQVLQGQSKSLLKTVTDIQVLKVNSDLLKEETRDALSGIRERVDQLPNIATEQFEILKAMLEQIQAQVATPRDQPSFKAEREMLHAEASSEAEIHEADGDNQYELQDSIKRLCRLAKQEGNVQSEQAEVLIEDVDILLDAVLEQISHPEGFRSHQKRKRANFNDPFESDAKQAQEDERDLKRIKGLLNASSEVTLNQAAHVSQSLISTERYATLRRHRKYDIPQGTVTIGSTKRRLRGIAKEEDFDRHKQKNLFEFTAKIEFLPDSLVYPAKVATYFRQSIQHNGFRSIHPLISVHMIVPKDSEVFECVKEGDLHGLVQLLKGGKASLRDCDEKGRSLLSYACFYFQPRICKFLIERGADVDVLDRFLIDNNGFYFTPLQQITEEEMRLPANAEDYGECQRLLLDAGADPMIRDTSHSVILLPFLLALQGNHPAVARQILELSGTIVDLEERNAQGETVLLQFLSARYGLSSSIFEMFLAKGPDLRARDYNGNTCLHMLLQSADNTISNFKILVSLIRAGADVSAVNFDGKSVSDTAYFGVNIFGPDMAYMWEAALTVCGYDIAQFDGGVRANIKSNKRQTIADCKRLQDMVIAAVKPDFKEEFYHPIWSNWTKAAFLTSGDDVDEGDDDEENGNEVEDEDEDEEQDIGARCKDCGLVDADFPLPNTLQDQEQRQNSMPAGFTSTYSHNVLENESRAVKLRRRMRGIKDKSD